MANKIILMFKNRKIISGIVILGLIVGGYFIFKPNSGGTAKTIYTYGVVSRGTIMQSVSGTGQITATRESILKSKVAGKVLDVKVLVGQSVKAGDVIAQIDSLTAQNSVKDAQAALENAQISLEKLNEPVDKLLLTQSQNAVTQANESLKNDKDNLIKTYEQGFNSVVAAFSDLPVIMAGLQDIVAGTSSYVVQSNATYADYYSNSIKSYDVHAPELVVSAATAYRVAKTQYDKNFNDYKLADRSSNENEIELLIEETYATTKSVAQALKNTSTLIQRYEDVANDQNLVPQAFADTQLATLSSNTAKINSYLNSLLSASQSIADAKSLIVSDNRAIDEKTQSLAKLNDAPDELDLKSQQLAVEQKKRALADAIDNLNNYTIVAPFDGVVATLDIKKSDDISANAMVATIITNSQIATITLNEVDIAKVKVGQKASLSLSAIDGFMVTGKVIEVGEIGTVSQGVVSYGVVIALDTENKQIKSGMSISATVIIETKQDVLLVPNAAVKTDNNGSFVLAPTTDVSSAEVGQQAVGVGSSDDTSTEITDGINEGDKIVVSSAKSTTAAKSTTSSKSLFNIGGGPR